jgi:uncharacterized protein YecT (DUF1311 family)
MSLILSLLILAQGVTSADVECDQAKADQGIQYAMNLCAHKDYLIADEALNVQWKITAAEMKLRDENFESTWDERPGYFQTLLDAQRAWIAYRDTHCTSEGYYARGGSLEPLLVSTCKTKLTKERTEQLQFLIEQ